MPRGKFVNHKGRNRHFTSPEELRRSSEDSEENEIDDSTKEPRKDKDTDSDPEELSSDLPEATVRVEKKGVAALIEIENPNRLSKNTSAQGNGGAVPKPELSRREREEIEKQKARRRYEKLHAQGKTTEAKADLARLALIRQEREAAAAKREAEKKALAKSLDAH
nr:28 kDa heat- and acid-stable phosphoprotein [Drosophila bipectinata]